MEQSVIYIVGSGAVGRTLAVFLQRAGRKVVLLRGRDDGRPGTRETFGVLGEHESLVEAEVEVSTFSNFQAFDGMVVLTNKSFGNADLAKKLQTKVANAPVVLLQNGLGVEQPFLDLRLPKVYRCVLFMTSQLVDANNTRFKPVAPSLVGRISGEGDESKTIADALNTDRFQFLPETNIQPVIWTKAIINSAFNSICPLLDVDNGIFHRNTDVLNMARRVIEEGTAVAADAGIRLEAEEILKRLLLVSRSSDGQLISTLQDIRAGRETEIDTLNFAIARVAAQNGTGEKVATIRLLGELTRLKSGLSRP